MSYPLTIHAAVVYIENHIQDGKIDYDKLKKATGFSLAHLRELFEKHVGISLGRYILQRKISNSAYHLLHSNSSILEIALDYGFKNHESYSRAFKRVANITPSQFRAQRLIAGKNELIKGVYGISLLQGYEKRSEISDMKKEIYQDNESTVLYGVPKVKFGVYGYTPFPICLKALSEYIGEDVDYSFSMVSSGAAFRLTWNHARWDLSNVDIYHTFKESNDVYRLGAEALGREFDFLGRDEKVSKEDFIQFIKSHIDEGYPCIALGIIGPPEACLITGYRDKGNTLLGWSFFQYDDCFKNNIQIDESGYFICDTWWENTDTQAVMCIGAIDGEKLAVHKILQNAVRVLEPRIEYSYSKGLKAYDAWKEMLLDERQFEVSQNFSLLFEKLMCQNDATACLEDGRGNAAKYFDMLAEKENNLALYRGIAGEFRKVSQLASKMSSILGDWSQRDIRLKNFANRLVRQDICKLIDEAKQADEAAYHMLQDALK